MVRSHHLWYLLLSVLPLCLTLISVRHRGRTDNKPETHIGQLQRQTPTRALHPKLAHTHITETPPPHSHVS